MAEKKKSLNLEVVARFAQLFEGNRRSSGRFDPKGKMFTEYSHVTVDDVRGHLAGTMGIGIVPIQDDDSCVWAAIDIDNHDSEEDLPIHEVDERITVKKLPLIACRSKSGGIHVYAFFDKPQPASKVRVFMNEWANAVGYPGSEIFPKQGRLTIGKDGKKSFGNWINLPYFGGDETVRYAAHSGKKLTLEQFITMAEKSRITDVDLRALMKSGHPDAPPCVQKMFSSGVAQGHRNEALYNIVVYLKKAVPDDYEKKAIEANASVFARPLPRAEMQRTITSAARPDCGYRCNEEPIRSLCDRDTCVTRRYGISSGDLQRLDTVDALPAFTDLIKYLSDPVRWEFKIDGVRVGNISTSQLLDWRALREIVADRLTRVVPMIKGQEWERILGPLMKDARIIETPDDASIAGVIRNRLREFASKASLISKGEDKAERKALLRGLPVVQVVAGERHVVFRAEDFINFLKRTKSEELKGVNLWFAIKDLGAVHGRMRIPDTNDNINVWSFPVKEVLRDLGNKAEAPEFKSDL